MKLPPSSLRILTLSNCPLVASQGSGYVITNFCDGLREQGHQVEAYGPEHIEPWRFLHGRARSYRQAVGMLVFCLLRLGEKRYDIVEFYGGESWLAASVLSRFRKRPLLVSHSNGIEPHAEEVTRRSKGLIDSVKSGKKWYHLDQTRLMKKAFERVDGIVTVSHYDADYALDQGYQASDRIVTIENSLPTNFLNLSLNYDREPIIGFCGSWIERKGVTALQGALERLRDTMPQCQVCLVGVGSDFDVERALPGWGSRLQVIPFVESKDDLQQIYQSLSVLILPSIYESFGLVAAEAMSCGCALVATRTGFAHSLIHQEEAWLLSNASSEEIAVALERLLADDELRQSIAKRGYARVQQLRWDIAATNLATTYTRWNTNHLRVSKRHS